ncbi:MAG TPA: protein arginine kinase [Gemmataceae bacterium]|nr:protein arginine kinase [Gemmataceae bacterium]
MNLDSLTHTSGEWLRGSGPESDIVISSRIRLARNLAAFPFTNRASSYQKAEIEGLLRDRIAKLELDPKLGYLTVPSLSTLDRQFLVERQLISRELAAADGPRGVALGPQETVSLMVNEEDHLRLQVMRSGFTLDEVWQEIDRLDDLLEQRVGYAFSEEFGYLTACPTNVGTGMRASVMLHLPALEHTKQIEQVFRALQKINLAVRGLYGEGSRASGHFYQISNQVTLGKSETGEKGILSEIQSVIPQIVNYERQSRHAWLRDNRGGLQDKVSRAYGTLCSATMMTSEETMELLSYVRLGVNLGLIGDITIPTVNELFIHTQPAHLQKLMGSTLDGEERNAARARYLRTRLREAGANPN